MKMFNIFQRSLDERERKLKALKENITQSIAKSTPIRQTKLAYIDSVVKPPRNVARQQVNKIVIKQRVVYLRFFSHITNVYLDNQIISLWLSVSRLGILYTVRYPNLLCHHEDWGVINTFLIKLTDAEWDCGVILLSA